MRECDACFSMDDEAAVSPEGTRDVWSNGCRGVGEEGDEREISDAPASARPAHGRFLLADDHIQSPSMSTITVPSISLVASGGLLRSQFKIINSKFKMKIM